MTAEIKCKRHGTTTYGDGTNCLSCDKERLAMFPNVDEDAVLACADRIKRAIGTEQPAVSMNACYLMMQAIDFLEGGNGGAA